MFLTSQRGYTLVETLVALAIIFGVLVPSSLFLGKLLASNAHRDMISATELARQEMETVTTLALYESKNQKVHSYNKDWTIQRSVEEQDGLVYIQVSVLKNHDTDPVFQLSTMRLIEKEE